MDKLIKYQILDENTSLYAEIELSNKITEEMKSKILNKQNKYLLLYNPNLIKPKKSLCCTMVGTPSYFDPLLLKKLVSGNKYNNYNDDKSYEEEKSRKKIEQIKAEKYEEKEKIMKMIKTQNFIEGFWDINETNKFIIEKYKKEYEKLKLKYSKDKVIITILIIYYLNKECFELMNELIMIIKKAKDFIQKEINCSYEDIVENL